MFTIEDVLVMTARGIIPRRAVLLDGDVYGRPPDSDQHIHVAMRFARRVSTLLYEYRCFVGIHTTLRLSDYNAPSPDIYVLAGGPPRGDVSADSILLVVEVADASLDDDLTDSASRYARLAVRDYWVVNVNERVIHVHRDPKDGVYPPPQVIEAGTKLQALLIPELTLTLDEVVPA
jgi:Uma2 family endonuclease